MRTASRRGGGFARLVRRCSGEQPQENLRAVRTHAVESILDRLRGYPEQHHAVGVAATAKLVCLQANRRAGKTEGFGAGLVESRLINRDHYVVRVLTHRLAAPTNNWIDSDGKDSLLRRLDRFGLLRHARIQRSQGAIKSIRFSWGSALHVLHVSHQSAIDDAHGCNADLWWVDEAQALDTLPLALGQLVYPTLAETDGQVLLSGTPGREIDSAFKRYSTGADDGFVSTRVWSWDNPVFGDTDAGRWTRIIARILVPSRGRYGLSLEDLDQLRILTRDERVAIGRGTLKPGEIADWVKTLDADLLRQYFGAWVVGGAEYVFAWHSAPEDFYYARTADCGFAERDEAALPIVNDSLASRFDLLPARKFGTQLIPRSWSAVMAVDIGWNAPSAWVILAWSQGYPRVFVLYSHSQAGMNDDEIRDRTFALDQELRTLGLRQIVVVADVNGTRVGTGEAWNAEYAKRFRASITSWVELADKDDKETQIRMCNLAILDGRFACIAGDALDIEGRHLRFVAFDPDNPKPPKIHKTRKVTTPDGKTVIPGDHDLDAFRYAANRIPHIYEFPDPEPFDIDTYIADKRAQMREREGFAR